MMDVEQRDLAHWFCLPAVDADHSWLPESFDARMARALRRGSVLLLEAQSEAAGTQLPEPAPSFWRDLDEIAWRRIFAMAGMCCFSDALRLQVGSMMVRSLMDVVGIDDVRRCLRWKGERMETRVSLPSGDEGLKHIMGTGASVVCAYLQAVSPCWLRRVLYRFDSTQVDAWVSQAARLDNSVCRSIAQHVLVLD